VHIPGFAGGGRSGANWIGTDSFFDTVAQRDSFFSANPHRLTEGAWCAVKQSSGEWHGEWQVQQYDGTEWQDKHVARAQVALQWRLGAA